VKLLTTERSVAQLSRLGGRIYCIPQGPASHLRGQLVIPAVSFTCGLSNAQRFLSERLAYLWKAQEKINEQLSRRRFSYLLMSNMSCCQES
jgi:hypothetical protein